MARLKPAEQIEQSYDLAMIALGASYRPRRALMDAIGARS